MGKNKSNKLANQNVKRDTQHLEETERISKGYYDPSPAKSK